MITNNTKLASRALILSLINEHFKLIELEKSEEKEIYHQSIQLLILSLISFLNEYGDDDDKINITIP